ncbi:MAG: type I polyketide synthase [Leptolyngbyaceae cyanobacterium]
MPDGIAIIGMSALYAKAPDLSTYWQNILNKVDGIQNAPEHWARGYVDPESSLSNRIYNRKAGFLLDLAEFNPIEFGIIPNSIDGAEPEQFLALKLARDALADSGYLDRPFNREKTGIIIGRGVYLNRGNMNYMQHGLVIDQTLELLQQICPDLPDETWDKVHAGIRKSLPPFDAQTIAGLVPNIMTGRIANRLDLMGPNYIVDAACAASLVVVDLAMQELKSGRCDMVVAGGVNVNITPQCCMMFCTIGALSHAKIHPFGKDAQGTLMGEGVGMLILKRLEDAKRDGDRIYAVVKGVGTASDGKSVGLLSPRLEGEVLALERAYQQAQIPPETIGLIEAHGTSIPVGDETEIAALGEVFGHRKGRLPTCAVGAVKSMVGHCLPGSGMAGIIKTALALYHKVLPPTLCDEVNPNLGLEQKPFYINSETRPWIHGSTEIPRRAGVNAFGFGGINAHAILEEYPQERSPDSPHLHRDWPVELYVLSAETRSALLEKVNHLEGVLQHHPEIDPVDLAYTLVQQSDTGNWSEPCRLAIVAKDGQDLITKLQTVSPKLADPKRRRWPTRSGIYYAEGAEVGKIAFLFSGEGGQYPNMLADLCLHFPVVRQWFDLMDEVFAPLRECPLSAVVFPPPTALSPETQDYLQTKIHAQDVASELNFAASRALYDLLGQFDLKADVILGHSVGETIALGISGILPVGENRAELVKAMGQLNDIYKRIATNITTLEGTLFTVGGVDTQTLQTLIETSPIPVYLALDNCPNQVVLFSETSKEEPAAQDLIDHFKQTGGLCTRLPYSRAHHTPVNTVVRDALMSFYQSLEVRPASIAQYSCVTCGPFPTEPDKIRALAADHWVSPVRFRETILKLYDQGVYTFIEVGPKGTLTGFVADILKGKEHLALATDSHRRSGLDQIQQLLGRLFVHQVPLNLQTLYQLRQPALIDLEQLEIGTPGVGKRSPRISLDLPMIELEPDLIQSLRTELRHSILQSSVDSPLETLPSPAHSPPMQPQVQVQVEPNFPLLGQIREQTVTRLQTERVFHVGQDLFLKDHTLGGSVSFLHSHLLPLPVIPFTFSMEMIAEAAVCLVGGQLGVISFHSLRGYRWLTLDEGEIHIALEAERQPSSDPTTCDVRARLFQIVPANPRPLLVFEGIVRLGTHYREFPDPLAVPLETPLPSKWEDENLYRAGMFHGPQLQGVTRIHHWNERAIDADLQVLSTQYFFAQTPNPVFQTDAGLLDSVGQLVWYWVADLIGRCNFMVFPYAAEAIYLYAPPGPVNTKVLTRGILQFTDDKLTESTFDLIDPQGRVVVRVEQWRDRYFEIPTNYYECGVDPKLAYLSSPWLQSETGLCLRRIWPFPDGFFESSYGIWGRILAHLTLSEAERQRWHQFSSQDFQRIPWLLGQIVAKDVIRQWAEQTLNLQVAPADIEIQILETGHVHAHCPELQALAEIPTIILSVCYPHIVATLGAPGYQTGLHLQSLTLSDPDQALRVIWSPAERESIVAAGSDPDSPEITAIFWGIKVAAARALRVVGAVTEQCQISSYDGLKQSATVTWNNYCCQVKVWFNQNKEALAVCHYPN